MNEWAWLCANEMIYKNKWQPIGRPWFADNCFRSLSIVIVRALNSLSDNSKIWLFWGSVSVDSFFFLMGHIFLFLYMSRIFLELAEYYELYVLESLDYVVFL